MKCKRGFKQKSGSLEKKLDTDIVEITRIVSTRLTVHTSFEHF